MPVVCVVFEVMEYVEDMYDEYDGEEEVETEESDDEQLQFSGEEGEGRVGGKSADKRELGLADSQTLTPDKLSKKMFELINEVNAVFQVSLVPVGGSPSLAVQEF